MCSPSTRVIGLSLSLSPLAHTAKQRPVLVAPDAGRGDPGVQELLETRMAGYLVALAALLVQPKPPALTMLEVVADLHSYGCSDPGEAVDHGADQCLVS